MAIVKRAFILGAGGWAAAALLPALAATPSAWASPSGGGAGRTPGAAALRPLTSPAAVFGADDRRETPEEYSALEGRIGMLYEPVTQTLCTGFCVAPGVVATASHCLFQAKSSRMPELREVTFKLDYGKITLSSGIAGARAGAAKHHIAAGATKFSQEPPLTAPQDWALAKLDRPICRFGHLDVQVASVPELMAASRQGRIFQIAYHWDWRHWQLAYSGPCNVSRDYNQIKWRFISQHFRDAQDLILHDCDTGGASSGSPMLMKTARGVAAVGINVGTYTRTRILLRYGRVVKRLTPDVIANTGVVSSAFADVIPLMENAQIVERREEIRRMQTALRARGLFPDAADGDFGRATRNAIRSFEQMNGMPPTGLPTASLFRRLMEEKVTPLHLNASARHESGARGWDRRTLLRRAGAASAGSAAHRGRDE